MQTITLRRFFGPCGQVLDASLERSMTLLLDAGMFDPLEGQDYTEIGFDAISSTHARELALDASRQAQVGRATAP